MSSLSIVIPTYNRPTQLRETIDCIVPQIDRTIPVSIYDNNSTCDTEGVVLKAILGNDAIDVSAVRHSTNISAVGNVLRAIEMCNSSWLWILADDDTPSEDAIKMICDAIRVNPDAHFINFRSNLGGASSDFATSGVDDFLERLPSFSNAIFLSTSIYNIEKIRPFLGYGYNYCSTQVPQFVTLVMSLRDKGRCVFKSSNIVRYNSPDESERWRDSALSTNALSVLLGMAGLVNIPSNVRQKNLLGRMVATHLRPRYLFVQLVGLINSEEKLHFPPSYLANQFYCATQCLPLGAWMRLKMLILTLLFRVPIIALAIYNIFKQKQ